jgi:hypothetical protein
MTAPMPRIQIIKLATHAVVVLDRVREGYTPPYCVHGHTWCIACESKVALGTETYRAVSAGGAAPMCLECAALYITPATPTLGRLRDHRCADGPH